MLLTYIICMKAETLGIGCIAAVDQRLYLKYVLPGLLLPKLTIQET